MTHFANVLCTELVVAMDAGIFEAEVLQDQVSTVHELATTPEYTFNLFPGQGRIRLRTEEQFGATPRGPPCALCRRTRADAGVVPVPWFSQVLHFPAQRSAGRPPVEDQVADLAL